MHSIASVLGCVQRWSESSSHAAFSPDTPTVKLLCANLLWLRVCGAIRYWLVQGWRRHLLPSYVLHATTSSTRACSSTMGSGSAEPSGGSSGGRQPSPLDLYSKGTQIIELGSAVWPENPIRTGRSEVYIWGTEHAVKLCMGPTFALHEYTMSRAARNYAVRTVAMFTIHGKPNGIVMERGKPVNPETCELNLKQIAFEMVRAVQGLHSIGIIHGDIKLSSFVVCRDGRVRLCDFGTSEYECDCVSHSEMSIPWSRPSLVRNPNRPRVKADDLYSLGLAIWELYTGKVPFVPPASEGWESLDINEVAEEAILAGEQVDLNDISDPEVCSVAASLVSEEVEHLHCQVLLLGAPEK